MKLFYLWRDPTLSEEPIETELADGELVTGAIIEGSDSFPGVEENPP